MKTVYLPAPGVPVEISRDGSDYRPHTLRRRFQFDGPAETTDTQMVFNAGGRRVRVDRANVIISRYDGLGGTNQSGA